MKVGIIGCGLIGRKRAASLDPDDLVCHAYDTNPDALASFMAQFQCAGAANWSEVVRNPDIECVVIGVFHQALAEITLAAVENGKHVLVEKPAARNAGELAPVLSLLRGRSESRHLVVKCGFNHRFHPGFVRAREILASEDAGEMMFVRARYGHGGRPGYEREWRADPVVSGGGELLDQGVHLIDLARSFLGDFVNVQGIARTYFWDMKVDDNAFLLLQTAAGQTAQLHVSWTEWKNLFSFEIYTKKTKLQIEGLGGSYGVERLAVYRMTPAMGPPDTTIYEFPGPDVSWKLEWANFKKAIRREEPLLGSIEDAACALEIVDKIYEINR